MPAITVELETADQVGIVLPEEGLIDETETTENTAYPEDGSLEETGEETEPAACLIAGQPEDAGPIANQSEETADPTDTFVSDGDGDLSADDLNTVLTLTASAENVDFPE